MFRTSAVPLVAACPDVDPSPMEAKKVFWLGNHASQRAWGAPVSKVHSTGGLQLLKSLGWDQVGRVTLAAPYNLYCTKHALTNQYMLMLLCLGRCPMTILSCQSSPSQPAKVPTTQQISLACRQSASSHTRTQHAWTTSAACNSTSASMQGQHICCL